MPFPVVTGLPLFVCIWRGSNAMRPVMLAVIIIHSPVLFSASTAACRLFTAARYPVVQSGCTHWLPLWPLSLSGSIVAPGHQLRCTRRPLRRCTGIGERQSCSPPAFFANTSRVFGVSCCADFCTTESGFLTCRSLAISERVSIGLLFADFCGMSLRCP